jgi:hypothetical protein
MDVSKFIVLSTDGSFFCADTAFLIDTTKLTEKQLELLCNGSDSDRLDLTVTDGIDLEKLLVLAALGTRYQAESN